MKKLLLLIVILSAGLLISAQQKEVTPAFRNVATMHPKQAERPVVLTNNNQGTPNTAPRSSTPVKGNNKEKSLRSLSGGVKLNEQPVGQSGNLLSVIESSCDQLSTDAQSNSVVFIHRGTDKLAGTFPKYRFDKSGDNGVTWTSNVGPVTVSGQIDGIAVNGRFPQGGVFNPTGGTVADSNYLVYSGTWHNVSGSLGGPAYSWKGQMRGVAKLDGDASTFTVAIDTINNGHTNIGTSFCQSTPGVFWVVNGDYSGYFPATGATDHAITSGIIVEKGVWNPGTKNVDWTTNEIFQQFDSFSVTGQGTFSAASSFNIAFDPTGQYGWVSCLGDITQNPTDSVYHPIFWYSQDSGATWHGPQQIVLDSVPGVLRGMHKVSYVDSIAMSGVPTTTFESKLEVDYLGNPHLFTTVANGAAYSIQIWNVTAGGNVTGGVGAGYQAYDINYMANRADCDSNYGGWAAKLIDTVATFSGTYSSDAAPNTTTEANRPLMSRSADGKKLFYYWLDTDFNGPAFNVSPLEPTYDSNMLPNLFTRAWDLERQTMTPVFNLTQGDSLFGGANSSFPGGLSAPGANFPVVADIATQNGSSYNVGLILTEIDYVNTTSNAANGTLGSNNNAAQYWYINNVTYSKTDFTVGVSATVQLNGLDTIVVHVDSSYVDSGAVIIYTDTSCFNVGQLHLVTDSSSLNLGAAGTYTIYYSAEDGSGNVYGGVTRVVQVVAAPVANFVFGTPYFYYQEYFTDKSTNTPTSWTWDFGDGSAKSYTQNPNHNFAKTTASYNVCLTAANAYGSDKKCQNVSIVSAGINETGLAEHINLYPNPSTGLVFIAVDASAVNDFTVSVYDMLGNIVVSPLEFKAGTSTVQLDLGLLATGTYMVKIQTSNDMGVKRLDLMGK